jgi:hypothetical protein
MNEPAMQASKNLRPEATSPATLKSVLASSIDEHLFSSHLELVPGVNEVYELQLAFYESRLLNDAALIRNAGYFARVGDTLTRHFLMCSGEPVRLPRHSSSRLRSFFQSKQFKTGYATHGLFPYRGKFHPQMIKGLLNAMGLRSGDTVLDPMMGSGTVLIEAALMGMSSVGLDASPFCRFMVQVKLDGFSVPLQPVRDALTNSRKLFEEFSRLAESRNRRRRTRAANDDLFSGQATSSAPARAAAFDGENAFDNVQRFLLLAYLDAAGYSERSQRKSPYDQFRAILERYLFVAEKIQRVLGGAESEIGEAKVLLGDARDLPLPDASVDGVVFSPPYSFAIDYLENDAFHLDFLRVNRETLRESMIGLRGSTLAEKFGLYKKDMTAVLSECARVLRHGRICTIVVGTNNNQLSKILEVPPEEVPGIDDLLVEIAAPMGLKLIRKLSRQITGMANTMRTEFILLLERSN